jgi:hypothetical protein
MAILEGSSVWTQGSCTMALINETMEAPEHFLMLSEVRNRVSDVPIASAKFEKGIIRPAALGVGKPSTYGNT